MATNRPASQPEPVSSETSILPSEGDDCAYPAPTHKPRTPVPESVAYPYPVIPTCPEPPSYSDVQKQPDSSDHSVDEAVASSPSVPQSSSNSNNSSSNSSSNNSSSNNNSSNSVNSNGKLASGSEESSPLRTLGDAPSMEESIQVAEISSSDACVKHIVEEPSDEIVVSETSLVESSLCTEEAPIKDESDIDAILTDTTNFVLDRDNWLQQVPEAEKYSEDVGSVDLQPIRFTEPQGPRLRYFTQTML
jgi:hypothetical protein